MERKMRRFKQLLSGEDTENILFECTNGILSLIDYDGMPYGVPVSYAYDGEGHIYMHSAVKGLKIDCIEADPRCSFCVVAQDCIVPEEFTTYFRSVIARGTISKATDLDEIMKGLLLLCDKYSADIDPEEEISKCLGHVTVLRMDITEMTGKESIELVRQRN